MNLYSQIIFPRLLDWVMAGPVYAQYRRALLANVQGEVLEIGFGTGLNLPHYPKHIHKLTTIDPNPGMATLAQQRIRDAGITVDYQVLSGEALPMADSSFDSVVSTWTLCSIPKIDQALREIYRVLKPGGRFFFIEHGLSNEPNIQVWQHRLTPLQKILAEGCHLNRDIKRLVGQSFSTLSLEEFYLEDFPKIGTYTYKGVATKSA